jgi:hypothetical protein
MQELDGSFYQKLLRGFAQPEVVYSVPYPTRGAVQGEDDFYASNFTQEKALCFSRIFVLWF